LDELLFNIPPEEEETGAKGKRARKKRNKLPKGHVEIR